MVNIKILVNFKDKKIVHTGAHVGSTEYEALIKNGYEKVGVFKILPSLAANPPFFWDNEYFDPKAKYINQTLEP